MGREKLDIYQLQKHGIHRLKKPAGENSSSEGLAVSKIVF